MTEAEALDTSNHKYGTQSRLMIYIKPIAPKLTTQDYAKHPITSRGILLDVAGYLARHELPSLSHFDLSTPITLDLLKATAKDEGVAFQPGDICVVRTGWTEAFLSLSDEQREAKRRSWKGTVGVDQGEEVLRWHWESGIAAVVSDT
jgi:hypothetical protein